jgi:hypothetical protein
VVGTVLWQRKLESALVGTPTTAARRRRVSKHPGIVDGTNGAALNPAASPCWQKSSQDLIDDAARVSQS